MNSILNSLKLCCGMVKQDPNIKEVPKQVVEEIQNVQQINNSCIQSPFEQENRIETYEDLNCSENEEIQKINESSNTVDFSESQRVSFKEGKSNDETKFQGLESKLPESFLISKSYNQKVQNERDSIDPYLQQRSLQTPELKPHISESSKQLNGSVPKNKKQRLREYTQKALKKSLQQFVVSEIDTILKQKEKSPINYSPQDEQNVQGCQGIGKEQVNLRKKVCKNQTVKSVRKTPYDKYHDIIQQQENEIKRSLQTAAMKEQSVRKISFN